MPEKRKINRRDFTYYMQVMDDSTKQIIGYLSDISTGGFKLDCQKEVPIEQDFRLSIQLTADIASKTSIEFIARSKWCRHDYIDPTYISTLALRSSIWRPVTWKYSNAYSTSMVPKMHGKAPTIICGDKRNSIPRERAAS